MAIRLCSDISFMAYLLHECLGLDILFTTGSSASSADHKGKMMKAILMKNIIVGQRGRERS
jgi:hypothetical protein